MLQGGGDKLPDFGKDAWKLDIGKDNWKEGKDVAPWRDEKENHDMDNNNSTDKNKEYILTFLC